MKEVVNRASDSAIHIKLGLVWKRKSTIPEPVNNADVQLVQYKPVDYIIHFSSFYSI